MSRDFVLVPDPETDVVGELLEACPSFGPVHEERVRSAGEPHRPYVEVGAFASYLVELYERSSTEEFPTVFRTVESLYERAGQTTEGLLTVGLLETMQNVAMNHQIDLQVLRRYLGPRTQLEWDKVIGLWG